MRNDNRSMHLAPTPRPWRRGGFTAAGFTLIELLVVIGIITLLAAILFPVISRTRAKGRQTKCISNQRQIAMSILLWVQDHEESLPATASVWQTTGIPTEILTCPEQTSPGVGYLYSNEISEVSLGEIPDPSEEVLSLDGDRADHVYYTLSDITLRHGKNAVASFVDGHVGLVTYTPPPPPDTSHIVFASDRDHPGFNEIYIMQADGSNQQRLTNTTFASNAPTLNAANTLIAFSSNRSGQYQIYTMDCSGNNLAQLTALGDNRDPVFSPGGDKILYTSDQGSQPQVYLMNANGTGKTKLTSSGQKCSHPAFSPDGTQIVFDASPASGGNTQIFRMQADGSQLTCLSSPGANDIGPCFRPDGAKILFQSSRNGNLQIYLMNADGSNQTRVLSSPFDDSYPAFNANGSKIVFESNRYGHTDLYTMNADGTNLTHLPNQSGSNILPNW